MASVYPLSFLARQVTVQILLQQRDDATDRVLQYLIKLLQTDNFMAVAEAVLKSIVKIYPGGLTNTLLRSLVPPHIKDLNLERCTGITPLGIEHVLTRCQRLQSIILNQCDQLLIPPFFSMCSQLGPQITSLTLENCDKVTDRVVKKILKNFKNLKHLNLSMCQYTTDGMFLVDEKIQLSQELHLQIDENHKTEFVCSLSSVDVSGCRQLTSTAVRHLTTLCGPTLQSLDIAWTNVDCTALWFLSGYSLQTAVELAMAHSDISNPGLSDLKDSATVLAALFMTQVNEEAMTHSETECEDPENESSCVTDNCSTESLKQYSSGGGNNLEGKETEDLVEKSSELSKEESFDDKSEVEATKASQNCEMMSQESDRLTEKVFEGLEHDGARQEACFENNENGCGDQNCDGYSPICYLANDEEVPRASSGDGYIYEGSVINYCDGVAGEEEIDDSEISGFVCDILSKVKLEMALPLVDITDDDVNDDENDDDDDVNLQFTPSQSGNDSQMSAKDSFHDESDCDLYGASAATSSNAGCGAAIKSAECRLPAPNSEKDIVIGNCLAKMLASGVSGDKDSEMDLVIESDQLGDFISSLIDKEKTILEQESCNLNHCTNDCGRGTGSQSLSFTDMLSKQGTGVFNSPTNDADTLSSASSVGITMKSSVESDGANKTLRNAEIPTTSKQDTTSLADNGSLSSENDTMRQSHVRLQHREKAQESKRKTAKKKKTIRQLYTPIITSLDIHSISFHDDTLGEACLKAFFLTNKSIQRFLMGWKGLKDDMLEFIVDHTPNLKILTLVDCNSLTSLGLSKVGEKCPALESLNLKGVVFISDAGLTSLLLNGNLKKICLLETQVTDITMKRIATESRKGNLHLQNLDLSWCEELTSEGLNQIAETGYELRSLILRSCPVTEHTCELLTENCLNLQELHLSSITSITDKNVCSMALRLKHLRKLDISWNLDLTDISVISLLTYCNQIEVLLLSGLKLLTSKPFQPIISNVEKWKRCQALLRLKLHERQILDAQNEPHVSSDEEFDDIYLPCRSTTYAPSLKELSLEYCDTVNDTFMAEVVAVCRGSLSIKDYYGSEVIPEWITCKKGKVYLAVKP